MKGKGRESNDFLTLDMSNNPYGNAGSQQEGGFQQMSLVEQDVRLLHLNGGHLNLSVLMQDNYLASRSTAIDSIESTIAELGQIFSQLATMVAQQGETVQRIDADTSDIANNVGGAQRELLRLVYL
jgi:syntaxin 5